MAGNTSEAGDMYVWGHIWSWEHIWGCVTKALSISMRTRLRPPELELKKWGVSGVIEMLTWAQSFAAKPEV